MLCVAEECCSTVQVKNGVPRSMDAVLEPIESVARSIACCSKAQGCFFCSP
jgi:hypothetical protein